MSVSLSAALGRRPVRRRAGLSLLVCAGVLWGTGGLTGTLFGHASGLSPIAVAGYRLLVGGCLLVAFLVLTGRRLPRSRAALTRIGLIAALAAVFQVSYFAAVSLTSVSLATLVTIATSPVLVLAAERVLGWRRTDRWMVGTLVLALAGLALLVGLPAGGFGAGRVAASAVLAVLAGAGFATMTLVSARPVPGLDGLTTAGYGFTCGGVLLVLIAASTAGLEFSPQPRSVLLLLALAIGPTALAYPLYFAGLRTVGPSTAAVLALLEPLTGTVLSALVLHDRLGVTGIIGAVLLGTAVLLATRAPEPTV